MNCLDCAGKGRTVPAVGVCHDCGAGVCAEHLHVSPHWLTRTAAINRTIVVDPPARLLRCTVCHSAATAASGEQRPRREVTRR